MPDLSHIDNTGKAIMVDVTEKEVTKRTAIASTRIVLPSVIWEEFEKGDIQTKKGSVVQVAVIAGIMAAKKTSDLIPLCHTIGLTDCKIDISKQLENELLITCKVTTESRTGVEMEALVGSSLAALCIYDMCKAMSHDIVILETKLIQKTGGKHDFEHK
jgi:cyclic pyranopterin monophosphate synthase